MGLSFLAPWFLAGIALLGIPYLIHRIRRPERELLPFSSIMFIPNAPREIIERRRIQHILLMILRMLVFLLLALAFARPVWQVFAANDGDRGPARHLLLLDTSYSMQAPGVFERAQAAARDIVESVPADEPVAVMTFDERQDVVAPYESAEQLEAGTAPAADQAIEAAAPSLYATNYLGALEAAQRIFLGAQRITLEDAPSERLVLHVVSDFTKNGMPDEATGWKLSPSIELETYRIAAEDETDNMALMDVAVKQSADGKLRVVGKVKNWSKRNRRDVPVQLVIADQVASEKSMTIQAGNASQVSFVLEHSAAQPIEGWLELSKDGLEPDNRRYFAWSPPRRQKLLLAAPQTSAAATGVGGRWPASFFVARALQPEGGLPFELEQVEPNALATRLTGVDGPPDLLVVPDAAAMTPESLDALRQYLAQGGRALIVWGAAPDPELLNRTLLADTSIQAAGPARTVPAASEYALFAWLDFEHPILAPFQGARFNDFST
ncbi:MAG: BatA domain-containing protein, partial [Candidatus Hydrogenedentales bacterium]